MRDDYTYHLYNPAILITRMVAICCTVTVDPTIDMTLPKPVAQLLDQLLSDSLIEHVYSTKYDHECQYNYIDVNFESYQSIIFLCNITCDIDMAAVIMTKSETCRYTLWHNNTYIGHSDVTDGIQLKLLKGDNYLCFVFNAPNFSPHLFVRCESILFDKMKSILPLRATIIAVHGAKLLCMIYITDGMRNRITLVYCTHLTRLILTLSKE